MEQERLIETATRIFAELGYDGASLQMIADAAGYDIHSVRHVAETKTELYRQVMQRAHTAEDEAMQGAVAHFTPDRQGIKHPCGCVPELLRQPPTGTGVVAAQVDGRRRHSEIPQRHTASSAPRRTDTHSFNAFLHVMIDRMFASPP
ncbi:TetR/AcrR family transcriptional regulator [Actinomadura montaniterrae]|uniref:TetR/AcrR family transcriptional regulator n=1 Tax=Actinomadura montaniterrae TaxID=1803903 RepID=A0A6L3VGG4_9ACTN|nr:TetR/AcrR family transcriptional regulator [Actinomadura montaniterrae]KAB2362971.1 TetR/AcrR family transcriptional regulator [Actinomadura montaniterrae]